MTLKFLELTICLVDEVFLFSQRKGLTLKLINGCSESYGTPFSPFSCVVTFRGPCKACWVFLPLFEVCCLVVLQVTGEGTITSVSHVPGVHRDCDVQRTILGKLKCDVQGCILPGVNLKSIFPEDKFNGASVSLFLCSISQIYSV